MSEDLILPFERRLNTQTEVEVLAMYIAGKLNMVRLSDALQERLIRLEATRDLYYKLRNKYKLITEIQNMTWHRADTGSPYKISQQQAYRDFDDMVELFNSTTDTSGLNFHVEISLADIAETRRIAKAKEDPKSMAACDKNRLLALEKFFGNQEAEEYKKLQGPSITTAFLPEQSKVPLPDNWEAQIQNLIKKKKRREQTIEDAEIIEDGPEDSATDGDEN